MGEMFKKILKLIFVKNRVSTNKFNNKLFNTLHTVWFPSAIVVAFLDVLGLISTLTSFLIILIHLILIIRNVNPMMFEKKDKLIEFINRVFRFSLLIFIFNVIVFTWSFAFGFLFISIIARVLYIELPKTQEKMKEQNEFKQQFGEFDGSIDEQTIVKKHIDNLFEKDISLQSIDEKILKKQFRDMAKIYHPDKNNGEHDDRFHSIKQSYDYLKEKVK